MKVLVVYATRHGATQGIAERIAATLETDGLDVTLRPVAGVDSVEGYDAYVIGSAAYMAAGSRRRRASYASNRDYSRRPPDLAVQQRAVGMKRPARRASTRSRPQSRASSASSPGPSRRVISTCSTAPTTRT
jgi:hypothetical protein